jgi:hypothetical protein
LSWSNNKKMSSSQNTINHFPCRGPFSTFMSIPLCFPWLVSYSCSVLLQQSSTITQLKLTSLCIVKLYTTQSLQVNKNIFYSFISLHMINDWLNNMDKCFNNCNVFTRLTLIWIGYLECEKMFAKTKLTRAVRGDSALN